MRVIEPYEMEESIKDKKIIISIDTEHKSVLVSCIQDKIDFIGDSIRKFTLSEDIKSVLYSKEHKYRKQRALLSRIRDILEESTLTKNNEVEFTYECFSIFCAALDSSYHYIMGRIDKWGYDIIDSDTAFKLDFFIHHLDEYKKKAEKIDEELYPKHMILTDNLEEFFWIVENDDSFPQVDEINEYDNNISLLIHEYEVDYFIYYL